MKNLMKNGGFAIDQLNEGTSVVGSALTGNALFFADGWMASHLPDAASTGLVWSAQRVARSGNNPLYSGRLSVITPVSAVGPDDRFRMFSYVRPEDGLALKYGRSDAVTASISFKARSSHAGTYAYTMANFDGSRCLYAMYTITTPNVDQYITINGIPPCTDGVWPTDPSLNWGYHVFTACMGSNVCDAGAPAKKWNKAPFSATKHHIGANNTLTNTGMTIAGFYLDISEVMLTATATAVPYVPETDELPACQRRFEKSYNRGVKPGTVTPGLEGAVYLYGNGAGGFSQPFHVEKLSASLGKLTFYSPVTGAAGFVRDYNGNRDVAVAYSSVGTHGFAVAAGLTAPEVMVAHYVYNDLI